MPFIQFPRARLRVLLPVAVVWVLAACDSESTAPGAVRIPVHSVEITTPREELIVGESHDYDAVPRAQSGQALTDRTVNWQSENEVIATIDANGILVARANGTVGIVATSENTRARFEVRVIAPNAVPVLTKLDPEFVTADIATAFVVRVYGAGFTPVSRVRFNGIARPTEFISTNELRMTLTPNDVIGQREPVVTVVTPAPGGGASTPLPFTIAQPEPHLTAINPARIVMGWGMPFTVTLTGTGFTGETSLFVGGESRAIDQRTATALAFRLQPADLTTARSIEVRVENPAPGGGRASIGFQVQSVPVASIQLIFEKEARWTWEALRLPVRAITRSATNAEIFDRAVEWSTSPVGVAQAIPVSAREGAVYGEAPGTAALIASADGVQSAPANIRVFAKPTYDVLYSGGVDGDRHIARWPIVSGNAPYRINLGRMAMHPAPSPDGRYFAFTGFSEAFPVAELYIARYDGKEIRQLTSDNAVDQYPAWSPDGERLAFESTRAGLVNIFTMRTDGTDVRQLTFARLADPLPGSGQGATRPVWSPDGQQIAYTSGTNGRSQLWVMNADGSNKRRLTEVENGGDYEATWTADGREILVRREISGAAGASLVRVQVATGSTTTLNVIPLLYGWTPSYSPDGEWLIMSEAHSMLSPALLAMPVRNTGFAPRTVLPAFWPGGVRDARWIRR